MGGMMFTDADYKWACRVAQMLRDTREEFEAGLREMDAVDVARIVPADEPEASSHRSEA